MRDNATLTSKTVVDVALEPEELAGLKNGTLMVLVHGFNDDAPHAALVGTPTEVGDHLEERLALMDDEDEDDEELAAEQGEDELAVFIPVEMATIEDTLFTGLVLTLTFEQAYYVCDGSYVVMVGKPDEEDGPRAIFGYIEDFVGFEGEDQEPAATEAVPA